MDTALRSGLKKDLPMFNRRSFLRGFAFIALLVAVAVHAQAQETLAPSYEPGDTFIYSNGAVERFVGESAEGLSWQTLSGRTYVRDRSFFAPILGWETSTTRGARQLSGNPHNVWPLEGRGRARFTVAGDVEIREGDEGWADAVSHREVQHWRCRAGAIEYITVPAGEFETYPIVCDRYSASSMRVLRRQTWYYAPDVGHYVRRVDVSFSSGDESSRDLLAALPARFANAARVRAILSEWRDGTD